MDALGLINQTDTNMFKTLLVEDNLNYRGVLKSALLKRFVSMEAHEASDESETMSAVDNYEPDLIIMDIHLKDGANGLDLIGKIKHEQPQTFIVILSQHDIPEYRAAARVNGADIFFSKSTSLENIFEYVSSVMHDKRVHL